MRSIFLVFLLGSVLFSADESLFVEDFRVSVFSKFSKHPLEIETSILFEGRDVEEYDFKIIDTLNVVIGSFYAEDLLTSKGKETFKSGLIKYTSDKYSIDIDNVYIQKLNIYKETTAKLIIEELRKEGYITKE